ncbi:MAG: hypothetical protein R6V15_01550 [Desulfotignum sp.]
MDNTHTKKDAVGENLLSVHDISREIDAGTALTRFVLKRFGSRFVVEMVKGRPWYAKKDLPLMLWIKQMLEAGRLPGEIEKTLDAGPDLHKNRTKDTSDAKAPLFEPPGEDIRIGKDGFGLIRSFFNNMEDNQKKIALAHEKRAAVEERKAAALEKRAAAEEKKAAAMGNIAAALQQMIRQGTRDPAIQTITHEAVRTIQAEDDLTRLLDTPLPCSKDLDDLADLLDSASSDQPDKNALDDLTRLVDAPRETDTAKDLDDLGVLITDEPEKEASVDLDDLSLLVQPSEADDMDDLKALVNTEPSLKPDISRDQDLEKYKAAVMKIIMSLKNRGVGAEETARRLNQDKVETISGKTDWTVKAISQIYSFIDAAS